ncbi:MAG: 16S rRNA (uracil(1498)-N(3))-methyltransferase [Saccharofermentanales bacterium]
MPRFFVTYNIPDNESRAVITGNDARHIADVLRMKKGQNITVCDNCGTDHSCEIEKIEIGSVTVEILDRASSSNESGFDIIVYQGIPKSDKMEVIIQKCVELGAAKIVPVECARCVVKLNDAKDIEKKTVRWNRIAYEAAKQSNRSAIPEVADPVSFKEAVKSLSMAEIAFIPWESEERQTIRDVLSGIKIKDYGKKPILAFLIGSEGGFDIDEIDYAKKSGIRTVSLGRRILRTETAAPAVLAMIMYEFELS